ncbi:phage tail tape measure protein [Pseudomonas sp. zfem002]|uniref:phage tail tape measure protein n=1 Tax=Pseudomonas sp. zfem002 TaxID=3078197 RepID=UPI002928F139|nr:phage tail tape measure protein [Pseudomonas sp. zfem002]MDU9393208.1 phage tail tape measure protein [Pseudomonas sp. zfem002]
MATIAELGVRVNSEGAIDAANDLDRLVEAGSRAEKSAAGVEQSSRRTGQALKEHARETVEAAAAFRKLQGGASAAEAGFFSLGNAIEKGNFVRSLNASKEADKWLASLSATTKDAGASFLEAGSKLTLLSTGLSGLGAWTGPGAPVFGQIGKQSTAAALGIGEFGRTAAQTEMSAKAMQAALRGVPAQFTDIIVSLQGGMNPLTVLLQQGGQLKDMFGGAGPAVRALGGYVAGLVNPFSLAAAAVGTLGLAYYQGSEEQDAFRQSLVTTGGAAGATTAGLAAMAKQVSTTVGTTGAAAAVLAQLAGTGKIVSSSFDQIAIAALSFEKATGKAASETVAEFAKLADDPVRAVVGLNEKYNFLTAAVFSQIQALQEQGDTLGAQQVAESAYADALVRRANEIQENLGYVESAWASVKSAAKEAWDAVLDVGREDTLDDKLKDLQKRLSISAGGLGGGMFSGFEAMQGDPKKLADQWTAVLQQEVDDQEKARRAMFGAQDEKRGVERYQELRKAIADAQPDAVKLGGALEKVRKEIADVRLRGYTVTEAEQKLIEDSISERYKAKPLPRTAAYREDAGTKALDQARQQYAVLQQQSVLFGTQIGQQQKLGEAGQALVRWEQQLADIKDKKVLTADQKSLLANQQQITAQLKKNAELEKEMQLRKVAVDDAQKLAAFQANLNSQLHRASVGLSNNLAGTGLGDQARQRIEERFSIEQQYQQQMDNLLEQRNGGKINADLYEKQNAVLQNALDQRLAMQEQYYLRVDEQQSDWSLGARAAFNTYLEQAQNVAGQTRSLFTNAFSNMEDAVATFVKTGKLSFKDFADGVIEDLIRIQVRQAAAGFLSTAFGFLSGGSQSLGQGTMSGFSEGAFVPNATGGVYDSPSLSRYSNQVHDSPQFFAFAKGAGVFAEAGPEAIMPLTRAPDGNLGVRAVGGGAGNAGSQSARDSAGGPNIQQIFHVNGDVSQETIAMMQNMVRQGTKQALEMVAKDAKANGPITQTLRRSLR